MFVVRAENLHGLSVPSSMSEVIHTLNANSRTVTLHQINEARARLATKVIQLKQLIATASTAVRISWEVSAFLFNHNKNFYNKFQKFVKVDLLLQLILCSLK